MCIAEASDRLGSDRSPHFKLAHIASCCESIVVGSRSASILRLLWNYLRCWFPAPRSDGGTTAPSRRPDGGGGGASGGAGGGEEGVGKSSACAVSYGLTVCSWRSLLATHRAGIAEAIHLHGLYTRASPGLSSHCSHPLLLRTIFLRLPRLSAASHAMMGYDGQMGSLDGLNRSSTLPPPHGSTKRARATGAGVRPTDAPRPAIQQRCKHPCMPTKLCDCYTKK